MGAWVVQSVERPTLDLGSGHDLTVHEIEPQVGAYLRFSLSLSLCPSPAHAFSLSQKKKIIIIIMRGAWVAQSVKHPTSAQVMLSQSVSSSPASGSVLTARSLFRILCLPLSLTRPRSCSVCLCLKNKHLKKKRKEHLLGSVQ